MLLSACGKKTPKAAAVPAGATVLALGDSLTQGVGASADACYPSLLAERTGWKVVNAGISGETSKQIADRLPGLLDEHGPSLAILCAGGNDWLQRRSEQVVQGEITRMLQLCKARATPVLLVAVPELSLSAALTGRMKDHSIYQTLAKDNRVALLPDACAPNWLHGTPSTCRPWAPYCCWVRAAIATARAERSPPRLPPAFPSWRWAPGF